MREESLPPWRTHDWKVRTIESIAPGGGSRLAFTCRSCGRIFNQTTINSRTWAVDAGGVALSGYGDESMARGKLPATSVRWRRRRSQAFQERPYAPKLESSSLFFERMARLKFNLRSVALGALILLVSAVSASAQTLVAPPTSPNDAMGSVKSVIDQSIVVFKDQQISAPDREQKLRGIAESHFDFKEMAKSTIGYHWKTLTPAQQSEFVPLFTTFIEDAYLSRIESYSVEKVNQQIQSSMIQFVKETSNGPDYAEVYSTVVLKDRKDPIAVNYLMRNNGGRVEDLRHHD